MKYLPRHMKCLECGKPAVGRWRCRNHYMQLYRSGAIEQGAPQGRKRVHTGCEISGCDRTHYARKMCKRHYDTWHNRTQRKAA